MSVKNNGFPYILSKTRLNRNLSSSFRTAINGLISDLQGINPLNLKISEYNQKYLGDKLKNIENSLFIYECIIGGALSGYHKTLSDSIFIEYGGGTGMMSILAKRIGIGTVIYNDIYDVSSRDAKEIASVLGCPADYYVAGHIGELVAFCEKNKLKCDIMVSQDVLEHIYNIDAFCRELPRLSNQGTIMVHATGANSFFYPCLELTKRTQIKVETKDRDKQWGHKDRDSLMSYFGERKKIIGTYAPSLNNAEIEQLARKTRGLNRSDILMSADRYLQTNQFPIELQHPTNTCDPYTGNWAEHLMNPDYVLEAFSFNGFDSQVLPVYWYNRGNNTMRKLGANLLNFAIRHSSMPLYFSGGYAIYAKYDGSSAAAEYKHRWEIYECGPSSILERLTKLFWQLLLPIYAGLKGITKSKGN
jgi:2-polyprenyl-3-methyl-5-hydroxy-6-metoxy-1,4-benzoquinol methylase